MQKAIVHQFYYQHPPEVVWQYLTEPELMAQWLMLPEDFKPVVGHDFMFKTKAKLPFGFDGNIYCRVIEVVPFKKLVYSWKGGLSKENPILDSVVNWTLTPAENGTNLLLEHSGFKGVKNYLPYFVMNKGWAKILKRLGANLKTA